MTEPTTEELVGMLNNPPAPPNPRLPLSELHRLAAQRLSDLERERDDLEGKLGEARKALEPFAEAWREAVKSAPHAPLGAINNLATYFIGAGNYQAAHRLSEALKLTASGGGDNSLSQGAEVARDSARPETQHSAGGKA